MTSKLPKQSFPSFASIISVVSIFLFLRVEFQLRECKERVNALEEVAKTQQTKSGHVIGANRNSADFHKCHGQRPNDKPVSNATKLEIPAEMMMEMSQFLSELKPLLCQWKDDSHMSCPPFLPGLKGKKGDQGQKGDMGPPGMPGAKGEPGESISAPTVAISPAKLTVKEGESASFQCLVTGNPKPAVAWSRVNSQSGLCQSAVSRVMLRLRNVTGSDAGIYRCSATNILGNAHQDTELVVNVHPTVSIHPGPLHAIEGSDVSLPTCNVTGHPTPLVTWSRSLGQLPQSRVESNNGVLTLLGVRKSDSDNYFCTATNMLGKAVQRTLLVVVSLPQFTVKPPAKIVRYIGSKFTLNCSATGDPQPVISWKRQDSQLPAGRSHQIEGALVIRDVKKEDTGIYTCVATSAGFFDRETSALVEVRPPLKDCSDLLNSGQTQSGVYPIDPDGKGSFDVYCDMRTDGGGWTVFQRRQDGSVDFYRGWYDYKSGFGQLTTEFWLGNDKIHRLTASRASSLRVELEDWNGVRVYAKYGRFNIGDEQAQYRLEVSSYSGTAGDSLAYHNYRAFSTKDRDNDGDSSRKCAVMYAGAWWFNDCYDSDLNGKYLINKQDNRGIRWHHFRGILSLKFSEMKLRSSS